MASGVRLCRGGRGAWWGREVRWALASVHVYDKSNAKRTCVRVYVCVRMCVHLCDFVYVRGNVSSNATL